MRISVVDSYLQVDKEYFSELSCFLQEGKRLSEGQAEEQINLYASFEKNFAVKWYEITAYEENKMIGFMRLLRNPQIVEEWAVFDIFVLQNYRQSGVAFAMYEKAIQLVREYEAAERIVASVARENVNSIRLHEKVGFKNIEKALKFADFQIGVDETAFEYNVYNYYPAKNTGIHKQILQPLWAEYAGSMEVASDVVKDLENKLILASENERATYEIIWCGNRAVGFRYMDATTEIEWKKE